MSPCDLKPTHDDVSQFEGARAVGAPRFNLFETNFYVGWLPFVVAILTLAPFVSLVIPDERVITSNVYCDYTTYYLPVRQFACGEMMSGRFPLWCPWVGGGMPLHAAQQATLCYPLLIPLILVFPVNYALRLTLFMHLALCFAGQYFLARSLGVRRPSAAFAAIVPTQCGYTLGQLMAGHVNHIFAIGLTPWLLLALVRHLKRADIRSTLFLTLVGSLFVFAAHPQMSYYALLIGTLWGIGSLSIGVGKRQLFRSVFFTIIAVILAVSIGLIQILPILELIQDSAGTSGRGSVGYSNTFALDGFDLLHFLMPNLRGNPYVKIPVFSSYDFFHERAGYVGLAPLLLSLVALSRRSFRRWEWGAAGLVVVSLAIALGGTTPISSFFGRTLPGFNLFRCPGRILGISSVFIGLLAARGLDAIIRGRPRVRGVRVVVLCTSIWLLANGVVLAMCNSAEHFAWTGYAEFARKYLWNDFVVGVNCIFATAVATGICIRIGRSMPTAAASLMIAVLLMDLGLRNVSNFYLTHSPVEAIPARILERDPPIRYVEVGPSGRLMSNEVRYCRSVGMAISNQRSMLSTNDGGIQPMSAERLFLALQLNSEPALAASACDYEYFLSAKVWKPVANVLPRCRFLPLNRAQLAEVPLENVTLNQLFDEKDLPSVKPRIVNETPQLIEIELDSPVSGLLILVDTFYPGWTCSIDGKTVPVEKVHGVFRGALVDSGPHRVEFAFQPRSFRLGCIGSLLGIASALTIFIIDLVVRRNSTLRHPSSNQ